MGERDIARHGGFSSGEDDIENYNAMVESEVREHLKPTLRTIIKMLMFHVYGGDYDIAFDFKPLRVMSSLDEEAIKTSKHNRYMQDVQSGFLNPQEYMDLQQKEKLIPIGTKVAAGAEPEPLFQEDDVSDNESQGDNDE